MKKQYLIYANEKYRKYFSSFYDKALVNYTKLEKISNELKVQD